MRDMHEPAQCMEMWLMVCGLPPARACGLRRGKGRGGRTMASACSTSASSGEEEEAPPVVSLGRMLLSGMLSCTLHSMPLTITVSGA